MEGEKMQIGDSIVLRLSAPNAKDTFRCKVIDKNEQFLIVDLPVNQATNKSTFWLRNTDVSVTFIKNGVVKEFLSKVKHYNKLSIPALAIPLPDKEDIRKIQRREFVRIATNADIAIHCPNHSFLPFTSITEDISGGGASVIIPPNISFKQRKKILVYLVLHSKSGGIEYIKTKAKVVRLHEHKIKTVSLKFLLQNEMDQEKIINYCFHIQREQRKREKLY